MRKECNCMYLIYKKLSTKANIFPQKSCIIYGKVKIDFKAV